MRVPGKDVHNMKARSQDLCARADEPGALGVSREGVGICRAFQGGSRGVQGSPGRPDVFGLKIKKNVYGQATTQLGFCAEDSSTTNGSRYPPSAPTAANRFMMLF